MAVKKAGVAVKKAGTAVTKSTAAKSAATRGHTIPAAAMTHVQMGYQLNLGNARLIRGQLYVFKATTNNGSVPIPTGPHRIPGDWAALRIIDSVSLPDQGVIMDVAIRFRPM